jgi:CubicO group peptidase (beta-lactamase class C family)
MRSGATGLVVRLSLLAAFITPRADAQQPSTADLPSRIDRIFSRFDRATPGCGVGLAKDGRTLYTQGYGAANLEYGVPNTDSTVFESGSVAKQFTSAAIVLLAQDGKLSLDDDIRKYLPEVPSFGGQRITIRNLLTHTSGLRDQWGLLGIEGRGPGTQVHSPMTTLDLVVHQKMLNFPPGSEYLYSNTGYALASIIVERVSGKSFSEFTRDRLFRPSGHDAHTVARRLYDGRSESRYSLRRHRADRLSHRHAVHEHDRQRRFAQHDVRPDALE